MPQRTLGLIILLAVVSAFLVYLAIIGETSLPQTPPLTSSLAPTISSQPEEKGVRDTEIYFNPSHIPTSSSSSLMVNPGKNRVTAVQLEMSFDTSLIKEVTLVPASGSGAFFDSSAILLFQHIDHKKGRISYAVGIGPTQSPKTQPGRLAELTFIRSPQTATSSSQISFLEKTMVTEEGTSTSVLKLASPLTIDLLAK